VIAIHLRATASHGQRGALVHEAMADDVAAGLLQLSIGKARFMGYSLGAAVALQVAIRHKELVEMLVAVSVAFRADGDFPEVRQAFAEMPGMAAAIGQQLSASPLAQLYPDVDWETMMRKTGEMYQPDRDWSEGIKAITAPTLLVFADADSIRPSTWSISGSCSAAASATPGSTAPSAPPASSPSFPGRRTTA